MKNVLVIYGPTATGKTSLATKLAKKLNAEIISADSRQVYKGLDIGTGKVGFDSHVEKQSGYWIVDNVKIHGFDLVKTGERFTAADFIKFATVKIKQITDKNKLLIITGGTGFYINSLLNGIGSLGIPSNLKLRQKLERLSAEELYKLLEKLNSPRAKSMNKSDSQNPRRLIRAIEIATNNSHPSSTNFKLPTTNYLTIGLSAPNDYLYQKSDIWLQTRLDHGLIEEVGGLIKNGISLKWLDNLGLEYRWISRFLTGKITKLEAVERLKGDMHDFIRRQKTWFNKFKDIKIFDISSPGYSEKLEKTVSAWYYNSNE